MRYIRMLLSFFLSAFLLLALPLTAYAGTASSSDASRSDALRPPMDDFVESDDFDTISPLVSPTAQFGAYALTNTGQQYSRTVLINSRIDFPVLTDGSYYTKVWFDFGRDFLPSAGIYNFRVSVTDIKQSIRSVGVDNVIGDYFALGDSQHNVSGNMSSFAPPGSTEVIRSGNLWSASSTLELSSRTSIVAYYCNLYESALIKEISLLVREFYVSYAGADDKPVVQAPGSVNGSGSSDNVIADNTTQQVEQGNTIIELIKNTIQTISSQLTAFWNQLAGEFTNLYNKMNAHHSEDLAKVDEQISADRQNTDDLISNQDKNTDTMVNGYDNSGMNSDNDRLNSSLTEYGQAEDNLMGDVNKHIGSIDFDYSFDSIVNVVGSVSDFFQGIYERSGQFQIVINVCLILSLASCAVGIYRLKGGG